jgi:hypothetical protein
MLTLRLLVCILAQVNNTASLWIKLLARHSHPHVSWLAGCATGI